MRGDLSACLSLLCLLVVAGCTGPGDGTGPFTKASNQGTLTLSAGEAQTGGAPTLVKTNIPLGVTSDVVLMQLKVAADPVEAIEISTLVFSTTGTGHDVDDLAAGTPVSLYLDGDADGVLDPGETLIDQTAFTADDGQATVTVNRQVPAGSAEYYLLVYDFSTTGATQGGDTFQPYLDVLFGVTATGVSTGVPPLINGVTVSSVGAEVVGTALLDEGAQNPVAASISSYAQDLVMLQVEVSADGAEGVTISSLTFTASGTGDEAAHIQGVSLYEDVNDNGAYDPGTDQVLGTTQTFSTDNGTVTFSGLSHTVAASTTSNLIVTYDFNTATGGLTYALDLGAESDITVTGALSGETPFLSGAPVSGAVMTTITTGVLTVAAGSNNPASNTDVAEGTTSCVLLQLNVTTDSYEAIDVTSVTFTHSGTGVFTDVGAFTLQLDADGDGTVSGGDSVIATTPTLGATTVTFTLTETLPASANVDWILVYDFATGLTNSGGHTFSASLASNADLTCTGQTSGPLGATILPQASPAFPIGGASPAFTLIETLTVSVGAADPGGQGYMPPQTLVVFQLQLDATCGPVNVTSLTLTPSGSGDDMNDLSSLDIYDDANGNGLVDGGETLLGTGVYTADNGARTYTITGQTVSPGTSANWIVVYGMSGGSPGDTYLVEVNQASHVSATGQGSTRTLTPQGSFPVQSGTLVYIQDTLTVAASSNNPATNGSVSRATANVLMLGLTLTAGSTGAVDVSSLKITASGKGLDQSHISSAAVYEDTNGDGVGDTQLATTNTPFSTDDGTCTFTFSTAPTIGAGASQDWVVVYNFNSATVWVGCTFRAGVAANADVVAVSSGTTVPATVTGVGTGIHGAYRAIQGIWQVLTPSNPTAAPLLLWCAGTYDANADAMMIYGGLDLNTFAWSASTYKFTLTGNRGSSGVETWSNPHTGGGLNDPPPTYGSGLQYYQSGTNHRLVLVQGIDGNTGTYLTGIWTYNLANNTWSNPTTGGTAPNNGGNGYQGMATAIDTSTTTPRLLFYGGHSVNTSTLNTNTYALSLGTTPSWSTVTALSSGTIQSRTFCENAGIWEQSGTNARFWVLGGYTTAAIASVQYLTFGTTANTWNTGTALGTARYYHSAVYDSTAEQIIVHGGYTGTAYLGDMEVYVLGCGPSVWKWTQSSMTNAPYIYYHTAVWDQNTHRMIVFGGAEQTAGINGGVWELY